MNANSPLITGVMVAGTRWDPYETPDRIIEEFHPQFFLAVNATGRTPDVGLSARQSHVPSRLGLPNVGIRVINVGIQLHTHRGNRETLASHNHIIISLEHHDDHDDMARTSLFGRVIRQYGFLSFYRVYQQALCGPGEDYDQHITLILDDLATVVPGADARPSFTNARGRLQDAIQTIDNATFGYHVTLTRPMPLYGAWLLYVERNRRWHFRRAGDYLRQADAEVERFAAYLVANGIHMDEIRLVCQKPLSRHYI